VLNIDFASCPTYQEGRALCDGYLELQSVLFSDLDHALIGAVGREFLDFDVVHQRILARLAAISKDPGYIWC
jgi:hypothetical protein